MDWHQRTVPTNGISLHVAEAGLQEGPPVILLHGFPEFHYGWKYQIPALAHAGFHVVAPDQRGYNLSDKPRGTAAYNLDLLAQDVIGLADSLGWRRFALVGHDWGAAVAWWTALRYPDRLSRLVVLNVPHPIVFRRILLRDPGQWLRSVYIGFFQLPRFPERLLSRRNWRAIEQAMRATSRPGTFSDADFARYREAWSQPGAVTAMLNWYRAIVQKPPHWNIDPRVHVPTLMLWGVRDAALGKELAKPSIRMCDEGKLVFFEQASHWLQHEEPDQVNHMLLGFLRSERAEQGTEKGL